MQFFILKLKKPAKTQQKLKKLLIKKYKQSRYFLEKKTPFDKLPPTNYHQISHLIDYLTEENIKTFEFTSGSSSKIKRIPYTPSLLKSFQKLIFLWAGDLSRNLSLKSFKFYFLLSPQFSNTDTPNGFDSDKEYLGTISAKLSSNFFVEIPFVKKIENPDQFKLVLSLFLISNRDLEVISIWSPSFLLELLSFIQNNRNHILELLKKGSYESWRFPKAQLKNIDVSTLFPSLKVISAWGSAMAQRDFFELEKIFPNVYIQKKGLLATEAPITFPLIKAKGFVPLLDEVYMEFIDDKKEILQLDQLKINQSYEIIISQKGGLYRYKLNDRIKVTHFFYKTPCFEFIARTDATSDLVGEKIHETDVLYAIKDTHIRALIPSLKDKRYYCLVDKKNVSNLSQNELLKIEQRLLENFHYFNAKKCGQLKDLKLIVVSELEERIALFLEKNLKIKRGDQKTSCLYFRESEQLLNYLIK
jgi:hypothetical protein